MSGAFYHSTIPPHLIHPPLDPSQGPPPLLVKIAPDLNEVDKVDIAAVLVAHAVDGIIVSNTTIQRPGEKV